MSEHTMPDDLGITTATSDPGIPILWERYGGEVHLDLTEAASAINTRAATSPIATDLPPGARP